MNKIDSKQSKKVKEGTIKCCKVYPPPPSKMSGITFHIVYFLIYSYSLYYNEIMTRVDHYPIFSIAEPYALRKYLTLPCHPYKKIVN